VLATFTLGTPSAQSAAQPRERVKLITAKGRSLGGPYQRWVSQAKVPTVRGSVKVLLTGCPRRPRYAGCVFTKRDRTIYLRRSAPSQREVLLHELGHLFDLRVLGRADRRAFKRATGRPRARWFRGVNPPAEQFAEGYALCALRERIRRRITGGYGFRTGPRRHRRTCAIIHATVRPKSAPPSPPPNPPPVTAPPPQSQPPPGQPPEDQEPSLVEQLQDLLPG